MTAIVLLASMLTSAIWAGVCVRSWPQSRLRVPRGLAVLLAVVGMWMLVGVLATLATRLPQPPHSWLGDALLVWLAAMLTGVVTVFVVDTGLWLVSTRAMRPRRVTVADLYPKNAPVTARVDTDASVEARPI